MGRAQDACQDLLAIGAVPRAIAAAAHLPRYDGGPQGLLGAPIGRVQGRVEEEAEETREFGDEVLLQERDGASRADRALEEPAEPLGVLATRDREAVRRPVPAWAASRVASAACRICFTATTKRWPG